MKRINNLYQKVCSIENLQLADKNARRGKRRSIGVRIHDQNKEENIRNLNISLLNKMFKTSRYHIFQIFDPKQRDIYQLPYYPDRIVHHAVMNILEPVWTKIFTNDTYACIKGKGIHLIVKRLKREIKDEFNTRYCLKLDIRKFYPNINHDILKKIIRRKIKDPDLLWLLDSIIDSADGVPIGNYLSQYFANLYLAYFDHWIKEEKKVRFYYRYADDMIILDSSKEVLHQLRIDIAKYFESHLKLQLKDNYQVFPVKSRGIDFVGYRFFHTHTLLRKSIKQNFARALKGNTSNRRQVIAAYWGWAKHCDSLNLLRKLAS